MTEATQDQGAPAPNDEAQEQELKKLDPSKARDREKLSPRGDYTHGHPGMPPENYEQPKEKDE